MRECEEGTESARRERRVDSLVANTARRRLRGDMMDKVQAADMLVTKAQDEIRVKVGQLTAAKWMGKVNLVKKERVIDKIKAARGKNVTDAFRWNLAMARITREKQKVEDEMGRMVCEKTLEGMVEEIVLAEGEEGDSDR